MEASKCTICQKPKANFVCGVCEIPICKSCAEFVDHDSLDFLEKLPELLSYPAYCPPCFDNKVVPEIAEYDRCMELAKEVVVFYKAQGKESRSYKRTEKPIKINDCPDRNETLLRMAFRAAQGGFNALVDVEITHEKVRDEGYSKFKWHGSGIPVKDDPERLKRTLG
jgi:hypothetical protein